MNSHQSQKECEKFILKSKTQKTSTMDDKKRIYNENPYEKANPLSKLFFWYKSIKS
jgi:hypothetical protein